MPKPFSYFDKGTMATIGRSSAVAELEACRELTGLPRVGHLDRSSTSYFLLGNRNRLATMINLGSRYLFWKGGHNAIVGETPPVIARHAPPGAVLSTPVGALTETPEDAETPAEDEVTVKADERVEELADESADERVQAPVDHRS